MTFAAPPPRLALGAPLAALITVVLAMLMQALIAQKPPVIESPPPRPDLQITSSLVEMPPLVRDRPEELDVAPAPPAVVITKPDGETIEGGGGLAFNVEPPPLDPSDDLGGFTLATLPPQLIFTPVLAYPQRMYPREGSCTVGFDITDAGATANVRAQSCTDRGFARAAESAVRRFQYKPAQDEHGPIASAGHSAEIVFTIDE